MKLWVIIMVWGHVYAAAGPLNYSMWRCPLVLLKAKEMIDMRIAGGSEIYFKGRLVVRNAVTTKCVRSKTEPEAPMIIAIHS